MIYNDMVESMIFEIHQINSTTVGNLNAAGVMAGLERERFTAKS